MQADYKQFQALLQQETEEVNRLLEALNREHQLLFRRETDAIGAVVADKEEALGRLNQLAGERSALLLQAGYSDDKAGFSAFINSDESGELADKWQVLEEGLRGCQQQNQLNGMLLESSRQLAQQMLSIIVGQHTQKTELYDQSGASKTSYGQNTSIKV